MSGIDEMMRRISESFNQQSAMATLGVVLEQVETGQVTLGLSYVRIFSNDRALSMVA